MTIQEMHKLIDNFVKSNKLQNDLNIRVLDLVSEVGELSKEILKGSDYGKSDFQVTQNWTSEIGDVLFALICIANSTNVDIEAALTNTLEKYQNRINEKGSVSSGR